MCAVHGGAKTRNTKIYMHFPITKEISHRIACMQSEKRCQMWTFSRTQFESFGLYSLLCAASAVCFESDVCFVAIELFDARFSHRSSPAIFSSFFSVRVVLFSFCLPLFSSVVLLQELLVYNVFESGKTFNDRWKRLHRVNVHIHVMHKHTLAFHRFWLAFLLLYYIMYALCIHTYFHMHSIYARLLCSRNAWARKSAIKNSKPL